MFGLGYGEGGVLSNIEIKLIQNGDGFSLLDGVVMNPHDL
jgi:hypothetical protein